MRRDQRGTIDLPLRLLASVTLACAFLGLALAGAGHLRADAVDDWARRAVADLQEAFDRVLARPGSSVPFDWAPAPEAEGAVLEVLPGRYPAARITLQGAELARGALCAGCSVDRVGGGPATFAAPRLLIVTSVDAWHAEIREAVP